MRSLQALRIRFCSRLPSGSSRPQGGPRRTTTSSRSSRTGRSFQKPKLAGGVPDYTRRRWQRSVAPWRATQRLAAIDSAGWPVRRRSTTRSCDPRMNGLDFDHRVLQPWARNPAFYVTVVATRAISRRGRAPSPTAPSSCSVGGSPSGNPGRRARGTSRANSSVAAASAPAT